MQRATPTKRELILYRDGRKFAQAVTVAPLLPNSRGNVQTLEVMRKVVLEDYTQIDLRHFVARTLLNVDLENQRQTIALAFRFCRDEIKFFNDVAGVERVADLWSCLYALDGFEAKGDCVIKSVALATMLAMSGLKPFFIVIKSAPNQSSFNHVFVGIIFEGELIQLDPTPENFEPGDAAAAAERAMFAIFD